MTERVEKIEVEKRIFVADDGTEFQTEKDCRQYEQDCAERNAKFIVAKLPHFTCSPQWIDPDFAWERTGVFTAGIPTLDCLFR